MDEQEAILQLKDDNREAFSFLYKRYWKKVYNFTKLYILSSETSEEIVQEVFIKLWESRKFIDVEKNFDGYLFIITRNLIFNLARKDFNHTFYQTTVLEAMDESYSIEEELETSDLREYISSLLATLPPRQQEVFSLSRDKHLTYKEIAEKLKISEKTVEHHMSEALKFLRKNLKLYSLFVSL